MKAPEPLDIPALVAAELPLVEQFYKDCPNAIRHKFATDEEFIRGVIDTHLPLISLWGGWRRPFDAFPATGIPPETLRDAIRQVKYEYGDSGGMAWPNPDHVLYGRKIFTPRKEGKDFEIAYAAGYRTKIRPGQTVSKAVLRSVREQFPDRPECLQMFERFFELLGQAWASARNLRLTLSCAPSTVLKFGHYGVHTDDGSCFHTGGQSERTKVNLAMLPNSFSALFFRTGEVPSPLTAAEQETPRHVQGRLWGVWGEEGAFVVNLKGLYGDWYQVLPTMEEALSQLFGKRLTWSGHSDGTRYPLEYWEINRRVASDDNVHVFAEKGKHKDVFADLKRAAMDYEPAELAA